MAANQETEKEDEEKHSEVHFYFEYTTNFNHINVQLRLGARSGPEFFFHAQLIFYE